MAEAEPTPPRNYVFPALAVIATVLTVAWWRDALPLNHWIVVEPTPVNLVVNYLLAVVLHIDPFHLVFNLYWIHYFAPLMERRYGLGATVATLLLLSFGTGGVELLAGVTGVGLSGLIYGLLGFTWAAERHIPEEYRIAQPRLVRFFTGWFFFCIVVTWLGLWNVGNVAHGSGAAIGVLLGFAWHWPDAGKYALWAAIPVLGVLAGQVV